jgi:hypothetical protein
LRDEDLKKWVGKPMFKRRVIYAYSPQANAFTFFTPTHGGRGVEPIGVFTPLHTQGISYDVEAMVEEIAEHMSLFDNDELFDIESEEL